MTESKPSKSERKREQQALQALGEKLVDLGDDQLQELDLEARLREAIVDIRRMKSHEARRRQKQYIGKLMRDVDPVPIHALLDRLRADDRRQKRVFANAERWRDRIVLEGNDALGAFEDEIGVAAPEIGKLVTDLHRANSDRIEQGIRRSIFREIHAALAAQSTDR